MGSLYAHHFEVHHRNASAGSTIDMKKIIADGFTTRDGMVVFTDATAEGGGEVAAIPIDRVTMILREDAETVPQPPPG